MSLDAARERVAGLKAERIRIETRTSEEIAEIEAELQSAELELFAAEQAEGNIPGWIKAGEAWTS